mmetsp:Transcript_16257/g.23820  ORF Transcript_16257/g.23820 Transcript_16257/m.23820 type:complete len:242 (-) Transcript_16257:396-1121(-)
MQGLQYTCSHGRRLNSVPSAISRKRSRQIRQNPSSRLSREITFLIPSLFPSSLPFAAVHDLRCSPSSTPITRISNWDTLASSMVDMTFFLSSCSNRSKSSGLISSPSMICSNRSYMASLSIPSSWADSTAAPPTTLGLSFLAAIPLFNVLFAAGARSISAASFPSLTSYLRCLLCSLSFAFLIEFFLVFDADSASFLAMRLTYLERVEVPPVFLHALVPFRCLSYASSSEIPRIYGTGSSK